MLGLDFEVGCPVFKRLHQWIKIELGRFIKLCTIIIGSNIKTMFFGGWLLVDRCCCFTFFFFLGGTCNYSTYYAKFLVNLCSIYFSRNAITCRSSSSSFVLIKLNVNPKHSNLFLSRQQTSTNLKKAEFYYLIWWLLTIKNTSVISLQRLSAEGGAARPRYNYL